MVSSTALRFASGVTSMHFWVVEGGAGRPRAPKFSSSFGAEKPAVFVSERARNPVEPKSIGHAPDHLRAPASCRFQFKHLELLKMFDPSWLQCASYHGGLKQAIADNKSLPCLLISSPAADGSSCWLSQALVVSPCFIFSLLQTLRDQLGAWADLVGKAPFAHVRDQVPCFLQGSADHAC